MRWLVRTKKYIKSYLIRFMPQVKLLVMIKKLNCELHFVTCFNQRKVEIKKGREEEGMNSEKGIDSQETMMKEGAIVLSS